ncbi:MAG: glycosyltransferase, partial [Rikenellaceae bacterium]|nr:glycosyltransferase [Rikenellaceae bacterium]
IDLSLLVATYNRADYLARTLRSLAHQTLDPGRFEIVVVDNNSADATRTVCEEFRVRNPGVNFTYHFEPVQGLSTARNSAIACARGEVLVMLDDDVDADPDLAQAYVNFFAFHHEADACGGKVLPLYETTPPRWRSYYTDLFIASALDLGDRTREFPSRRTPIGANFGFRRAVPASLGGFDPNLGRTGATPLGGEEKDFINRLRGVDGRVWYLPGAVVHHLVPAWKLTDEYFDRVTRGMGASERIRSLSRSWFSYAMSLAREAVKWGGAVVIALGYALRGRGCAGWYLLRMRRNVTAGLLCGTGK